MRTQLKHIHRVQRKLADGRVQTYIYAWRGGPRLTADSNSPEFVKEYADAWASRKRPPQKDSFFSIISSYKSSAEFEGLSARTRSDYLRQIGKIEDAFGEMPLEAMDDPRVRQVFLKWRDRMAAAPRQADYAMSVLRLVLTWAVNQGMVGRNPIERPGKLAKSDRSQCIWSESQVAKLEANASPGMRLALLLALETGQRQGDLLRLPWSSYDGEMIRIRQGKTGAQVAVPATKSLKEALDQTERQCPLILTTAHGRPWTTDGFRTAWHRLCRKAGVRGLTFHDLRGTCVTRLAQAGCSVPEIASITGHSLRNAEAIIQKYMARTEDLSRSAIFKLEKAKEPGS